MAARSFDFAQSKIPFAGEITNALYLFCQNYLLWSMFTGISWPIFA